MFRYCILQSNLHSGEKVNFKFQKTGIHMSIFVNLNDQSPESPE